MSVTLVTGLLIQAIAGVLLFSHLGRAWVRHPGAYFIIMALLYHGVTEILALRYPDKNINRKYLTPDQFQNFFILISAAIFIVTVVYLVIVGKPSRDEGSAEVVRADLPEIKRILGWKPLLLVTLPLIVWTASGRGATAATTYGSNLQVTTVESGLAYSFLTLAAPLTAMALVLRFGRKAMLPAILFIGVALGFAGERTDVVIGILLFAFLMALTRQTVSRRFVALGLIVVIGFGLIITATRAQVGRDPFNANQTSSSKIKAYEKGAKSIFTSKTGDALATDLGYRFDGNTFGAMELGAIDDGQQPLGLAPVYNNVVLAVPSFLYPQKLNRPIEDRLEKLYAQQEFSLPRRDILATQLGSTVGYYGVPSLILGALLIGVVLGAVDRWLTSGARLTPARLVLAVGAVSAYANYGRGLESWTISARNVLVLALVLWFWSRLTGREKKRAGRPKYPVPTLSAPSTP